MARPDTITATVTATPGFPGIRQAIPATAPPVATAVATKSR